MNSFRGAGTCEICRNRINRRQVLQSNDNILYCRDCFRKRFCQASGDETNQLNSEYYIRKRDKLIPYPEMYTIRKGPPHSNMKGTSVSMMSLSKRPLQCPKADCNKFVSIFTLESHFKYEHKEIPIILSQLDARSALDFYPRDVRYGITQCIVLLTIMNHDFSNTIPHTSNYCSKTNLQTLDSRPVMLLLATRVAGCQLAKKEEEGCISQLMRGDDERCYYKDEEDNESSRTYVDDDGLLSDDKIIIWMASNIFTNLSYTVAASTLSNKIRQKYFGPMLTLGENPVDLCADGSCLMLTHFHIKGMSENGIKPLALDVVIHSPD